MKFINDENKVIKLCEDSWIRLTEGSSSAPVLEVQLPKSGVTSMQGFEFVIIIDEEPPTKHLSLYFDQYANPMVANIMKKMIYFPGIGLGKRLQGIVEPVKVVTQKHNFCLGYKPTAKELRESKRKSNGEREP